MAKFVSYWFFSFEAYYSQELGNTVSIKGNGIVRLNGDSFLPGTVTRMIEKKIREQEYNPQGNKINVVLSFYRETDQKANNDFDKRGLNRYNELNLSYFALKSDILR